MSAAPTLLASLVERLKAPAYWKSSDGYSEAFDNAPEQAATALEALAAENGALRSALDNIRIEAEREQGNWTHLKRVIGINGAPQP